LVVFAIYVGINFFGPNEWPPAQPWSLGRWVAAVLPPLAILLLVARLQSYLRHAGRGWLHAAELVRAGQQREAEEVLRGLLRQPDTAPVAATYLAVLLSHRQEYHEALGLVEEHLNDDWDLIRFAKLTWQSRLNLLLGNRQTSAVAVERFLDEYPDVLGSRIHHARWLRNDGSEEEAVNVVEQTLTDFDELGLLGVSSTLTRDEAERLLNVDFEEGDEEEYRRIFGIEDETDIAESSDSTEHG